MTRTKHLRDLPDLPPNMAERRKWIILGVLLLPTLLVSMDFTVTFLAIPVISRALHPTSTQLLWITDIYGFMEAGFLITMGTLGDRIGRRRILLTGSLVFASASVLAAFSRSPGMLIFSRAILGISGSTIIPSILSIIRQMFHQDSQRALAIGMFTTCFSVGTILGPLVGGALLDTYWWGSVYLMGLPVMVLLFFLGRRLIPEFLTKSDQSLDLNAPLISILAVLALVFGIKRLAASGFEWIAVWSLLAATGLGFAFYRGQRRAEHPIIDWSLFRIRAFNEALIMLATALFCWAGSMWFVAVYLQQELGMKPLTAGIWTVPSAAVGATGCIMAAAVIRYIPRKRVMRGSMFLMALGMAAIAQFGRPSGFPLMITGTMLLTLGCSMIVTLGTDSVLMAAPAHSAGTAAGLSETCTTLGSAFGIALLGSLGTAIYRSHLASVEIPGVSGNYATGPRATLGAALSVPGNLPSAYRHMLEVLSGDAFARAFALTMLVSAALVSALVLGMIFLPRKHGQTTGPCVARSGSHRSVSRA